MVVPLRDGRFAGMVAFITGATSGIGRATALAFAREVASVVVADVAAEGNHDTARLIEQAGGHSLAVSCDVTRADDIKAALHAGRRAVRPPGHRLQQRGIEQPIKPAHEITDDEWDRLLAVNLRGASCTTKRRARWAYPGPSSTPSPHGGRPSFTPRQSRRRSVTPRALTRVADTGREAAFQHFHDALAAHFSPEEMLEIVAVVVNMNIWTRIKLAEGAMPRPAG